MTHEPEDDLADAAARLFGITGRALECGYILRDGRMLDLSGRHYDSSYVRQGDRNVPKRGRDYNAGVRMVDHRELGDLVEAGGTDGMLEFMARTGAIRALPPQGFTVIGDPTPRQVALMCAISRIYRDETYLEVYDRNGDTLAYGSFRNMQPDEAIGVLVDARIAAAANVPKGP